MPLAVIRASAGSGKTYQLAVSFIRILLKGELQGLPQNPAAILATTFTRAAAGEILDRVLRLLSEAALSDDRRKNLAKQIGSPLSLPHCHRLLTNLAGHMDRLAISTMDAFFAQIAKAFASELGLAPDWTMAVDEGEEELLRETLHAILGEADLQSLAEALWTFRRGVISSMLGALAELAPNLDRTLPSEEPADTFARPEVRRWSKDELASATNALANSADWIPKTKAGTAVKLWEDAIDKLRAALTSGEEATALLEVPLALRIFNDEDYSRHPIPAPLAAAVNPLLTRACDALAKRHKAREAALLWLAQHYQSHRRAAAFRAGAYTFSDIATMVTSAALAQDDLYFRLGTRFEHVLFDEFQDTSRLQFHFFRPIIEEIGGGGGEVLVVGDEKQAIYGWRGGDRELMHGPLDDLGKTIGSSPARILSESYRSSPAVLDAVNCTFQTLSGEWLDEKQPDKDAIESAGREWSATFPEHKPAKDVAKLRGRVRVVLASAGEGADAEEKNQVLISKALDYVGAHLAEDSHRKIGILLRKKHLMPRLIADIRRAHPEVDVSGEGGNPLTDSRAVEIILSLLTWLDHPESTAARYLVLTSPLAAAFGLATTVGAAERKVLRDMRHDLTERGYATTLRKWIRHPEFSAACSDHDAQRCEQLLGVAREFDARGPMRPSDFAAHVRKRRMERPGGSGVRVMTIHASKGLEFEAVLLLELDASQGGRGDVITGGPGEAPRIVPSKKDAPFLGMEELISTQVSADFMEELSVLYVGMTRARSYLDIILREGTKAPLAILLRRALQVDADRVVEEFDGLSMRECDEAKGRGGLTLDKPDPGLAAAIAASAKKEIPRHEGRAGHTTPSGHSEASIINVTKILAPTNRFAMQRGDLIHAWLRQITWLDDGLPDADALIKSTTEKSAGIDRAEVATWARRVLEEAKTNGTELQRTFAKPSVARGETLELWRERAFAVLRNVHGRPEVLSGSFDRVVLWRDANGKATRASIIDFKTDRSSCPEERAAIEARHAPQLGAYRSALLLLCPELSTTAVTASLVSVNA